jgi:hypothetical protein
MTTTTQLPDPIHESLRPLAIPLDTLHADPRTLACTPTRTSTP